MLDREGLALSESTLGRILTRPSEGVQIDHMSLSRDGDTLKAFKATCPMGKQRVARVYSRATTNNAKRFLQAVREDLPYPLRSIQIDGGGEFRAEFEDACQTLELPLAQYQHFTTTYALTTH